MTNYDVAIVGGGILGLSTSYVLRKKFPKLRIILFEKESSISMHQTGHNSGVIHSGIYYKPGSSKAQNCRLGVSLLKEFCDEYSVPYEMCGKLIIATEPSELEKLNILYKTGNENGLKGLRIIGDSEMKDYEPFSNGLSAIHCPETGIIDYIELCKKFEQIISQDITIKLNSKVVEINNCKNSITICTNDKSYNVNFLINCAGLFSDMILKLSGLKRKARIVPFRGEYFMLKQKSKFMVKNLIYPVPNPEYPFLGVHFTRTIDGNIEAGPNAVLAFAREGYKKFKFNYNEIWDYLSYSGFWNMSKKYWKVGLGEYVRSISKRNFTKSLNKLIPDLKTADIEAAPSGVRAQALGMDGKLLDDFVIKNTRNMIHVINAPSPAATSCLAISEYIVSLYKNIIE